MAERFLNYIGGRWVPARSGRMFQNLNPATGETLGEFPDSDPRTSLKPRVAAAAPRIAPGS